MNNWRNHLLAERTQLIRLTEQLPQASVIERLSLEARVCEIEDKLKGMGYRQTIINCSKCGGKVDVCRMDIGCQYFVECVSCGKQGPVSNYDDEAVWLWNEQQGAIE